MEIYTLQFCFLISREKSLRTIHRVELNMNIFCLRRNPHLTQIELGHLKPPPFQLLQDPFLNC